MTYRISCAGCGKEFRFRSLERIGLRVRQHSCNVVAPDTQSQRADSQKGNP